MIQFVYPWVIVVGVGLTALVLLCAYKWRSVIRYRFSPLQVVQRAQPSSRLGIFSGFGPQGLRLAVVLLLILAAARPRMPDTRSSIKVEGVGIMLALDVSRSMLCFDDLKNPRPRFEIAQEEAITFIKRRSNDVLGLVLFGAVAATRCPLTADHTMLVDLLRDTKIGIIPDTGTALSRAIIMGVQRLRASTAQSRIMVLLTDGEPSPEDVPLLGEAVSCALKAGVKIYTIGIGSAEGGFIRHPSGGVVQVSSFLRADILCELAHKTGGDYFEAHNQQELGIIYNTIDQLEKTVQEQPIYMHWYECGIPLLVAAGVGMVLDMVMRIWRISL